MTVWLSGLRPARATGRGPSISGQLLAKNSHTASELVFSELVRLLSGTR